MLAALAAAIVLIGSSSLRAQFNSGLEGTVFDPNGAVLPNATVTLHEVSTGVDHSTQTTSAGNYHFTALPPGVFTLTVSTSGFETATLNEIRIQVEVLKIGRAHV